MISYSKLKSLLALCCCVVALSCSEDVPKESKPKTQQSIQKTENKIPKPEAAVDTNLITDQNVVEKLTRYGAKNPETIVKLHTSKGTITIKLFKDTPLHRANFIMLAKRGYFNGTVFMRVVKDFMAQGGAGATYVHTDLRKEIGYYTVPAEFSTAHIHKRGAVAAAREYRGNPEKRSDPYMFYMVEGTRFTDETLDKYERKHGKSYSAEQRAYYTKNPGAAHLDNEHTVFGEIIDGYEVIPKITAVETDRKDWPIEDIFIEKVEIIR